MKKKTNYHITYSVDNELKHYFTDRIVNAREFISNNFSSVLSCWREIKTKKKSSIERIFRNRKETEPKNYFNNRIKAINKLND